MYADIHQYISIYILIIIKVKSTIFFLSLLSMAYAYTHT